MSLDVTACWSLKRSQFFSEVLVRQQASAGRGGIAAYAVPLCEFELNRSRTAADTQQLFPMDQSVLFGSGGREMGCGKRTKDHAAHVRVALDDMEGIAALGHGALPQDFARYHKGRIYFLHHDPGFFQHESLAVDTGVDVFSISVHGPSDEVDVFLTHIHNAKIYSDRPGDSGRMGFLLLSIAFGKGGRKVEPQDIEALFHNHLCGQDAV
jgi:hypothetical protein